MRRAHDVEIDARRVVESGRVDGAQLPEPLRHAPGDGFLARRRTVGELCFQRCAHAGVDAETGRIFGIVGKDLFRDFV